MSYIGWRCFTEVCKRDFVAFQRSAIFVSPQFPAQLPRSWSRFPVTYTHTYMHTKVTSILLSKTGQVNAFIISRLDSCKAQIPLGSSRHASTRHDTLDVSSASRRACLACRADKFDTAKMHVLDTSNVSCRVEAWRDEPSGIWALRTVARRVGNFFGVARHEGWTATRRSAADELWRPRSSATTTAALT